MAEIESQTAMNSAGVALHNGAYLYTALVHLHRSSAHLLRKRTVASFSNLPRVSGIPYWMGRNVGYISRTYFGRALSPQEVLRRHTLFGFLHLAQDKAQASALEKPLISSDANELHFNKERIDNLRWCKCCADEELDIYGFASWKVVHQITSVRICHIHGEPLLSRCNLCGTALGSVQNFRLPGDVCPKCNQSDFSGESIVVRDAYRAHVRDIGIAFDQQNDAFRHSAWNSRVSLFISCFPSWIEAQKALNEHLCRDWGVSSVKDIWASLHTPWPVRGNLFESGDRYLSVRILLHNAMLVINPINPDVIGRQVLAVAQPVELSKHMEFAAFVKQHANRLELSGRITDALATPLGVKAAAEAAGLAYATTHYAWKKVLNSMVAELGEAVVRKLLPEGRRVQNSSLRSHGLGLGFEQLGDAGPQAKYDSNMG